MKRGAVNGQANAIDYSTTTTAMSSSSSPQGQTIGKANKPWTIGRLLGSGACGSVHELVAPPNNKSSSSSTTMQYAVKVVALPPTSAKSSAANNKKRKKTAVERNADLLLHEYTILQNSGAVNRGTLFPDIPLMGLSGNSGPPGYGETVDKKFRYLVMERMASPLSEIVPILLSNSSNTSTSLKNIKIPLGDVTTALFNCIHAMHTQNYLFQDVKPDNFMLAHSSSSSATNNNTSRGKKKSSNNSNSNKEEVANRIRLIDFGLVERYSEMASTSHREDAYPNAQLVGTPTYASLNVMGGHTPSRRDDLEALGYVICELILLLVRSGSSGGGSGGGGGGGSKRKGKGEEDVLPWSHAKSDKELYQIKQEEMNKSKRSKSTLFNELKGAGEGVVDVQMSKYFNEVMNLEYAEKPDYDSLRGHLSKIVVVTTATTSSGGAKKAAATRGGAKKAAASPKKPAAASASAAPGKSPRRYPSRRTKEKEQSSSQSSVSSDENVENCKKQKVSSRTIATQTDDNDDEMICLLDDDLSENEVEDMDWEVLDNDGNNSNVANVPAAAAAGRSKSAFLKLEVISGSQKGQEVSFGDDYPDTVVVGRDPGSSTAKALKDSAKLALTTDDRVLSVHAKFVITSKKNMHSVRVTDMSSSSSSSSDSATLVNGTKLASGKSRQAFVGDKITIGGSILQVKRA